MHLSPIAHVVVAWNHLLMGLSGAVQWLTTRDQSSAVGHHVPPESMLLFMRAVSGQLGEEVRAVDQRASRTGCQTVWVEGRQSYIAKLALQDVAAPRLEENAKALRTLAGISAGDSRVANVIPVIRQTGRFDGQHYSVETRLPGGRAGQYLRAPAVRDDVATEGLRFLVRLQTLSRVDTVLDAETWNRQFQPMVDAVGAFVERHDPAGVYERISRAVRDPLLGQSVPLVFAHGNFWIGNLLFDPDRGLTGVIDWDSAVDRGLPLVDLLYFLSRTESLLERTSLGEAITKWIAADLQPLATHPLVGAYCREFSLPMEWLRPLFYYSWIQHVHIHVRYGTTALEKPAWVEQNLISVLAEIDRSERRAR
jgi:aminoglycoside phosphotransferase (APT) family kinase protein